MPAKSDSLELDQLNLGVDFLASFCFESPFPRSLALAAVVVYNSAPTGQLAQSTVFLLPYYYLMSRLWPILFGTQINADFRRYNFKVSSCEACENPRPVQKWPKSMM
jgi:hypothetical protein